MSTKKEVLSDLEKEKIQKKLQQSSELYEFALKLKIEQLKRSFPEKSDAELRKQAMQLIDKAQV